MSSDSIDRDKAASRESHRLQVLKILVWPVVAAVVVVAAMVIFRGSNALKQIELGPNGLKIAFHLLQAAERSGPANTPPNQPPDLKEIQDVALKASGISLAGSKVLWVDDNPQNQEYERSALAVLGIEFVLAKSTSEALPFLKNQSFTAVITDFKRDDDERGGYTLLEEVKSINPRIPVIIYSASATPELEAEAKKRGAFGETNVPQRLFGMTVEAILNGK